LKNYKVMLSLFIMALLAIGFVAGCGGGGDDGGDTGSVEGTVTDSNGAAIQGATATIVVADSKGTYSTTTDSAGKFKLDGVPHGTRTLTISMTGYTTLNITVTISTGSTYEVPTSWTQMTAEGYGNVSGTVTDITNSNVIANVSVAVGGTVTTSDVNGLYALSSLSSGAHTITASIAGYNSYSSSVTVVTNTTVTKNIIMTPN